MRSSFGPCCFARVVEREQRGQGEGAGAAQRARQSGAVPQPSAPLAPRRLAEEQSVALLRFCLHCNTHHQGRCPRLEQRRGSSTQRGYGSAWHRLVEQAIRHHPYCAICDSTDDLTGDHIVPLSQGGTNTMSNVQVLCRSCNSRKGGRGVGVDRRTSTKRPCPSNPRDTRT